MTERGNKIADFVASGRAVLKYSPAGQLTASSIVLSPLIF